MQSAPDSKGKIEAGVKYGQNNALKGRVFTSLAEQNLFLSDWERTVAELIVSASALDREFNPDGSGYHRNDVSLRDHYPLGDESWQGPFLNAN